MDEEVIGGVIVLLLFFALPFVVVLAITRGIAYSRTKAWDKARSQRSIGIDSETNRLVIETERDADSESEFYDTDEEEEHRQRSAEEEAERFLTFRQKFVKEYRKVWSGEGAKAVTKQKEREERRKLAKAIAREMARVERRKARRAATKSIKAGDLPPYKKA